MADLASVPLVLVGLSTFMEIAVLVGLFPCRGSQTLELLEMALMFGLLVNAWQIRAWVKIKGSFVAQRSSTADLTLLSLLLCCGGDLVNRNLHHSFYAYDNVIEHSYLVGSVWFFLPGYGLFIYTVWTVCKNSLSAFAISFLKWPLLTLTGGIGTLTYAKMVYALPVTPSWYVLAVTGVYSVVITLMIPAAVWIYCAFGSLGRYVAIGAILATIADVVIGQFWLFAVPSAGFYPEIASVNWILYFLSQALIQQIPLVEHFATLKVSY